MKKEDLKVGMSCEVITITAEEPTFAGLMKKGNTGIVATSFSSGAVDACIGCSKTFSDGIWFVPKGEFKKVGRLTVTKIKNN